MDIRIKQNGMTASGQPAYELSINSLQHENQLTKVDLMLKLWSALRTELQITDDAWSAIKIELAKLD